jgi:hypothetical protein
MCRKSLDATERVCLSSVIQQVEAPGAQQLSFGELPTACVSAMEMVRHQSSLQKLIGAFGHKSGRDITTDELKQQQTFCSVTAISALHH